MSKQENQLPQGWEVKKLGEVCDFQNGFAFQSKLYKESGLPILRITNIQNDEINTKELVFFNTKDYKVNLDRFKVFQGDLLIAMSGATTGKLGINNSETVFYLNQRVGKFIPMKHLNKIFLYYFLTTKVEESLRIAIGAAQPNLSTEQIYSFEIPLPSLPEQQRIVSILDEAFAAIAKAKANAEQNLKNSRELFESYLQGVFEKRGEGWEEKRFDEVCILQRGFDLPTHSRNEGIHPLVSSNGITDRIDLWKVKAPGVVTGRSGTIGNVHFVEEDYWPLNTALYIKEFHGNYERFVYYFLKQFDLSKYSSGAGVPTLNRNNVHSEMICFPKSVKEQQTIVQKFDALLAETQKLEEVYRKKIADLEELKKSLLQKAFSGEL